MHFLTGEMAEYMSMSRLVDFMESESCSVVSDSLDPVDYTVHGILQARILEWVVF